MDQIKLTHQGRVAILIRIQKILNDFDMQNYSDVVGKWIEGEQETPNNQNADWIILPD